jgi:hypothetical protein
MMNETNLQKTISEHEKRIEELEEALWKIHQWSKAYPLDIFPKPDLDKAAQLLRDGGISIDAVSAYVARHVVEGIEKIAGEALDLN